VDAALQKIVPGISTDNLTLPDSRPRCPPFSSPLDLAPPPARRSSFRAVGRISLTSKAYGRRKRLWTAGAL